MKYYKTMKDLKTYIENHNEYKKDNPYYDEAFCNLTLSYLRHKGEFTSEDIQYLHNNFYTESDFIN